MAAAAPEFSIDDYLLQESEKDLLRFSTAGSVDDGKSTLIGRLLYDTQSVYEDQVRSVDGKGTTAPGQIDFALLTDGLRAEREQGITIDVAYRYFSTARRRFIIADTPGHEQYTRNMATGASTADAAVVLIDSSKGVLLQSRRHAYIASLLGVRHLIVAVNKMDLIRYNERVFRAIERDFRLLLAQIAADTGSPVELLFVPVSALLGDNIVHRSKAMQWYGGPSLLELLEMLPSSLDMRDMPFRFSVQRVVRPDHSFRGFAGQIASGTVRRGARILVQPSGESAEIARIVAWGGDLDEAHAPLSTTLVLNHEVDISRGDLIVSSLAPATVARSIRASLVWMDRRPLEVHRRYQLKHTSLTVPVLIASLESRTDMESITNESAQTLEMNDIGVAMLDLLRPIAVDLYAANRHTGSFILIDPESNCTAAAGMISGAWRHATSSRSLRANASGAVTAEERSAAWGHRAGVLELTGPIEIIDLLERSLFQEGAVTCRIDTRDAALETDTGLLQALIRSTTQAGLLALVVTPAEIDTLTVRVEGEQIVLDAKLPRKVIVAVHDLLARSGILLSREGEESR
jgi:sulfate adenylyltransferase large subunit